MAPMADEEAFNDFVVARTPALTRTAYLLTHDHQLAEDLVQTALFKAAKAWHRIEGEPEPYVRRILYTENVSRWRRRRVIETFRSAYDAPAAAGSDPDVHLALEHALAELTLAAADGAGAALLRGPHRGRDGAGARDRGRHREVHPPPGPRPAA